MDFCRLFLFELFFISVPPNPTNPLHTAANVSPSGGLRTLDPLLIPHYPPVTKSWQHQTDLVLYVVGVCQHTASYSELWLVCLCQGQLSFVICILCLKRRNKDFSSLYEMLMNKTATEIKKSSNKNKRQKSISA